MTPFLQYLDDGKKWKTIDNLWDFCFVLDQNGVKQKYLP